MERGNQRGLNNLYRVNFFDPARRHLGLKLPHVRKSQMGPASSVLLESDDGATLDAIDALLAAKSDQINRTRKGRVWEIWIQERPIHVQVVNSPPTVELSAGCNSTLDRELLQELTECISAAVGIGQ